MFSFEIVQPLYRIVTKYYVMIDNFNDALPLG